MADNGLLFSAPMVRALWEGRKTQTRRPLYALRKGNAEAQMRAVYDGRYPPPMLTAMESMDHYYDLRHVLDVGNRIIVREAWRVSKQYDETKPSELPAKKLTVFFDAGGSIANQSSGRWEPDEWPEHRGLIPTWAGKGRPSMFMPRWASRMTLPVKEVRIERLLDISDEDAIAEGIRFTDFGMYQPPGEMSIDGGKTFHAFKPRQHDGWHWQERAKPEECLSSPAAAYINLWNHINGDGSATANPWVVAYTFDVLKQNIDETRTQARASACTEESPA